MSFPFLLFGLNIATWHSKIEKMSTTKQVKQMKKMSYTPNIIIHPLVKDFPFS